MKWEILDKGGKNTKKIIDRLLHNRGFLTKKEIDEFINPRNPDDLSYKELGINKKSLDIILKRLEIAKKEKQKIVVFGDYDADGICATAILWEALYELGFDAMPYIPDRFEDGYGIKQESFDNLKFKALNPELIITVDNGIVAYDAIDKAKINKIDVIVVDHHTKGVKKLNTKYVFHSTEVCGSALAWFLARELGIKNGLDLVALGTIADQMPLVRINRSLVKYGLLKLNNSKRIGIKSLIRDSKLTNVGVYEVGYIIAPRINAMGRLASATDSLRLLCTRDNLKAHGLSKVLDETNTKRQKIVEDVLSKTLKKVSSDKVIVIAGDYNEGVIGLASGKVTEKYYRPSVVLSLGKNISKASARSINGFNIINAIKETGLIIEGGGHPMAAGFSIKTTDIDKFRKKINEIAKTKLTEDILERKLYIDLEIDFDKITKELVEEIKKFEPTGYGNFSPVFMSRKVKVIESKTVGDKGLHLKLKLSQGGVIFDAIWFGYTKTLNLNTLCDVAYTIEENVWNNVTTIQLKIRDLIGLDL